MSRRKWWLRNVCLLAAGMLFGIGGSSWAQESYKVGAILPVTGPAAFLGEPEKKMILMMQDRVNAAGGINGHPLQVIIYDSEADATKAVTAFKRLVEVDNVVAIVGPSTTGEALAVAPFAQRAKIAMLPPVGASELTDPIKEWVFRPVVGNDRAVEKVIGHMKRTGVTKVATVTPAMAYGEDARNEFVKRAPRAGIEVVAQETYRPTDTDMTPQLVRVKGAGAQAILSWNVHPSSVILVRNVKQLGLDARVYHTHGWATPRYLKLAGPASDGNFIPSPKANLPEALRDADPQKPLIVRVKKEYASKYGEDVEYFAALGHDTLMLVVEALKKSGSDRAKLRDAIEQTRNYVGLTGVFNMSSTDHAGLTEDSLIMLKAENGKFVMGE